MAVVKLPFGSTEKAILRRRFKTAKKRTADAFVVSRQGTSVFRALVSKPTSSVRKIGVIRSGVAASVVDGMVEYLAVPKNVVFSVLRTPESTAHRLIKDKRNLDSAASERVMRVADILRMAEETFGEREAATQWLKSANLALGGPTPLSMLDTEPGAAEVRRVLSAINYGAAL